jgi:hypothetical protein
MTQLAYLLIAISFLTASFMASLDPTQVDWMYMMPAIAIGIVGVVILRRGHHAAAKDDSAVRERLATLEQSLANINKNLRALNADKVSLPPYEVRFDIDRLFRQDLNNFADARQAMAHRFGLKQYADVMSAFAAGERYINRVWSASADGYIDEIQMYIEKATRQFQEAEDKFATLHAQFGTSAEATT